jgi:predicted nucleic acid-binding protein
MSAKPFFDTTVLIYSISTRDPRAAVAEKLLDAGGYISVQFLNEFAAVARRKLNMSWEEISDALSAVRVLCEPPIALSVRTHEAALKIAAQSGYQIYDALILAAALGEGCDLLYSEDMQNGQRVGALTIRNPFLVVSRILRKVDP